MAAQKRKEAPEKRNTARPKTMEQLREEHPFETDSQIQNRYGQGRQRQGADSTPPQDGRGANR